MFVVLSLHIGISEGHQEQLQTTPKKAVPTFKDGCQFINFMSILEECIEK